MQWKNVWPKSATVYLAFENSFCTDYVTEKLFRTLNTEIIPIVYGGRWNIFYLFDTVIYETFLELTSMFFVNYRKSKITIF